MRSRRGSRLTVALVTLYCELDRAFAMQDILLQKQQAADSVDAVLRERGARGLDNAYDSADATLKRSRLASQQALNDERIKLTELQIGVLTGRGAERGLSLHRPQLAAAADAPMPAQLPVDLLGRRPDIVAARLRAEAALANIDATRAQFYPDVNLVAFAGLTALTPAALFSRAAHDRVGGAGDLLADFRPDPVARATRRRLRQCRRRDKPLQQDRRRGARRGRAPADFLAHGRYARLPSRLARWTRPHASSRLPRSGIVAVSACRRT